MLKKKTAVNSVKFGNQHVPISATPSPFIPQLLAYKENRKTLETLAYAINNKLPTLLIGETGVGKTSAIRYIAAKTQNSLRRVNVNGSMTAEDFVGQLLVNEKGTYWKDGVLTEAMRAGYWLVIDELNAASAEILFVLHSLLDDDHYIVLTDHPEREIVRAHPNFRIFGTMNPPERYAGTKELNKALLSRFPITLMVEVPSPTIEYGILSKADKYLHEAKITQLKNFVAGMRDSYHKEETDVFVSPRDVATIVRVYRHTKSLLKAVEITVQPRGTKAEQKAIQDSARLHFAEQPDGADPEPVEEKAQDIGDFSEELEEAMRAF